MSQTTLETGRIGSTDVDVTRLGLGAGYICGWPEPQSDETARATVARALDLGVRYIDVAPFYGNGRAEALVGNVIKSHARWPATLSTKVGRLLVPDPEAASPSIGTEPPLVPVFDFSPAGIERSLSSSFERLGCAGVDIALIHDPDDYPTEALELAYPSLVRAKEEGLVRAIGFAMNWSEPLARFAMETDVDCMLLAGRYTLLEQDALDNLMPLAVERGFSIIVGGVYNSGLLASPTPDATYNYERVRSPMLDRAQRLQRVCSEFDVPLRAAALQFPLAHPAVATVLAGASTPDEMEDNVAMMNVDVPNELWEALRERGLIRSDAPVPSER